VREAHELTTSPTPFLHAAPLDTDLFEWHFTLRGPPNSPFEAGIYHGRIILPPSYPLRPPSFRFATPSGRFETNREICLSISGHHEETWQPAWGIRTALVALRTFMETDVKGQLGGMEAAEGVRRRMAGESSAWRCGVCAGSKTNGEILGEWEERVKEMGGGEGEEVRVPEELKMGWRDEMGKGKGKGKDQEEDADGESDALAEGFVQTAPPAVAAAAESAVPPTQQQQQPLQPTRTVPSPSPLPVAAGPALQQMQRREPDSVTAWLDRLIVAVAILLAAVVAKVMFS
ncbi:ubiquitin-conjugating enzyme/RWD-like protein, partial [Staphylotrichum tortipilum]